MVAVLVAVTVETPVTIPELGLTVAACVLLLLHVPPPVASLNETVEPAHTDNVPLICAMLCIVSRHRNTEKNILFFIGWNYLNEK
jgi:hypothetical protein